MRRWMHAIVLGLVLGVATPALFSTDAYGQAGLDRIEQKVQEGVALILITRRPEPVAGAEIV